MSSKASRGSRGLSAGEGAFVVFAASVLVEGSSLSDSLRSLTLGLRISSNRASRPASADEPGGGTGGGDGGAAFSEGDSNAAGGEAGCWGSWLCGGGGSDG
eukprot:1178695-Prorocentrum_minimum.AAC.1